MSLPANTQMGTVALTVADLNRSLAYYQHSIGLHLLKKEGNVALLGVNGRVLLQLHEQPGARPTRFTTGLYHFALLLPSRIALSRTLHHLLAVNTPITGASDHGVSEALYLTDPDGHGIEIYRDRPRSDWYDENGQFLLYTKAFDVDGVLAESHTESHTEPDSWAGLPPETVMGHVHLHVAGIPESEQFYINVLGFELMARYGRAASFISTGGYHHHMGLNTWAGVGSPPAPPDTARLLWFQIILPNEEAFTQLLTRLNEANVPYHQDEAGIFVQDPSQNTIWITRQ
ncbi:MAG: catechol 2,3-dioxygenase [Candidatus Promineifilaceae bacterium]